MYSTFQNTTILLSEQMFHIRSTRPGGRSANMSQEQLKNKAKEELIRIIETLTDSQVEYLYHLTELLFCQSSG